VVSGVTVNRRGCATFSHAINSVVDVAIVCLFDFYLLFQVVCWPKHLLLKLLILFLPLESFISVDIIICIHVLDILTPCLVLVTVVHVDALCKLIRVDL